MKKVLATILSLVYLVATSGVGINLRYCCDKLTNVEWSYKGVATSGEVSCAMQSVYKGKNCCKDVHEQLKITQSQNTAQDVSFPPIQLFAALQPCFPQIPRPYFSSIAKDSFSPHAPPFRATNPVYLENCSFLI